MNLYVVLEDNTSNLLGVFDSLEAAKMCGEVWAKSFYIIECTLNSPPNTSSSGHRKNFPCVYESD
jgi:hypothetical protein